MYAVVCGEEGTKHWAEVEDPKIIDDTDVVVQIDAATICGTDLHILEGDVPEVTTGRILGHEAVGTVLETGMSVRSLQAGDRVLVSCISACGHCQQCRAARYGLCTGGGGWLLGHAIDGVQAEYARIPFADFSCHLLPDDIDDERALFLADVFPTAYEVGVRAGNVSPGDVVAIVGAGPIGLAAAQLAKLTGAGQVIAIDPRASRLHAAHEFGADVSVTPSEALRAVKETSGGRGADVVIEAVGAPESFALCTRLVRKGGHVANVGVHGKPVELHMESLWSADLTISTALVDTNSTPQLLNLVKWARLDPSMLTTQRFSLSQAMSAYNTACDPDRYEALKVLLQRD